MKWLCKIAHRWQVEFNYVPRWPRWEEKWCGQMVPTMQWRRLRTCKRCKKIQLERIDLTGMDWWEDAK